MNNETFYEDLDFKYPEIAIVLESGWGMIKLYIPALMPFVKNAGLPPKSKNINLTSASTLNKEQYAVSSITSKNYITLGVPGYIGRVFKGEKLIISFIGGDPSKPVVIGRC